MSIDEKALEYAQRNAATINTDPALVKAIIGWYTNHLAKPEQPVDSIAKAVEFGLINADPFTTEEVIRVALAKINGEFPIERIQEREPVQPVRACLEAFERWQETPLPETYQFPHDNIMFAAWQGWQSAWYSKPEQESGNEVIEEIDAFIQSIRDGCYSVTDNLMFKAAEMLALLRTVTTSIEDEN